MIKSITNNLRKITNGYPKLMESKLDGSIVFMFDEGRGVTIDGDRIGVGYDAVWDMNYLKDFHGNVILENEVEKE